MPPACRPALLLFFNPFVSDLLHLLSLFIDTPPAPLSFSFLLAFYFSNLCVPFPTFDPADIYSAHKAICGL